MKKYFLLLLFPFFLLAQDAEKVLIESLQGIILKDSSVRAKSSYVQSANGIEAENLDLTSTEWEKLEKRLRFFIDQPLTQSTLIELRRDILQFYRQIGRPFVLVNIPEQSLSHGEIVIEITESHAGEIEVTGNRYFSSNSILKWIRLQPGDPIYLDQLTEDLSFINRNPFRSTDMVFSAGKEPDTTDIDILVSDRRPLRIYFGTDNTGLEETGPERVFTGLNWGNVFGLGHIFSYQFTSSYDFSEFRAHTGHYTAPLPWRHILEFFGGYSSVDAGLNFPNMRSKGHSWQVSGRYTIPLKPHFAFLHEFKWGADFKRTNNNVEFGGLRILGSSVNLFQLMANYNLSYSPRNTILFFELEAFGSPGRWLPDQSNALYNQFRPFAKNQYIYGRGAFQVVYKLPLDFQIEGMIRGQYSLKNLLPSDQFGLGGYDTVRGYEEREVNVDNALVVNYEMRTPAVSIFTLFSKGRYNKDQLRFLAFVDFGLGANHKKIALDKGQYILVGVGPGMRYRIEDHLAVRVDWGFQLHKTGLNPSFRNRVHFSVILNY